MTLTLHPPDASHLLITSANLVEVRAQAAKCPPHTHTLSPHCLSLSFSKAAKYGPEWGQREVEGERERRTEGKCEQG